jgi:DNA-binding MarR family transcriptional regulator/N-acetylglutamate synthase-like GNAT family acetyltransferase
MNEFINSNYSDITLPDRIKKLGENLLKDVSLVYKKLDIKFEPRWFNICQYLVKKESASISEIAIALDLTHPAIIHLVNEMEENNIIRASRDAEDGRKRMISLSDEGSLIFNSVLPLFNDIEKSLKDLSQSAGYDILNFINTFEKSLKAKSFYEHIMDKHKKRLLDSVEIVRYSPAFKNDFLRLNYEWLNKYFTVEEEDKKILANPEEVIINKGGEIFFARIENEIVGTCAAIKHDKSIYELAKMAVTEKAQGKQAGKKLSFAVIGFAYSKGAKSVILDTNSNLQSAINLYDSLGFKTIPGIVNTNYTRPTFRMKLELK